MYKKTINKYNSNSKKIGTFFAIIVIIAGIIILYFINIAANKYTIRKDFNLEVNSNYIEITGYNNTNINLSNVKSISFIKEPISVDFNLGGGNINNVIFGKEYIECFGPCICFIENLNKPSIFIKTISENYFINFSSKQKTIYYFNKLKKYQSINKLYI